ncbi:MAG: hypothetical protein B7733_24640 [Myxococcales bacterium FL481]|nr:MAG: hypothetical protein B7733_24640 [Myxococcales bacterium FL481]
MATRPSSYTRWDNSGTEPTELKKTDGHASGQVAGSDEFNWQWNSGYRWEQYLDQRGGPFTAGSINRGEGLEFAVDSGRTVTLSPGTYVIDGAYYEVTAAMLTAGGIDSREYAADRDTFVYYRPSTGAFGFDAQLNGAPPPPPAAGWYHIGMISCDATDATVANQVHYVPGTLPTGTSMSQPIAVEVTHDDAALTIARIGAGESRIDFRIESVMKARIVSTASSWSLEAWDGTYVSDAISVLSATGAVDIPDLAVDTIGVGTNDNGSQASAVSVNFDLAQMHEVTITGDVAITVSATKSGVYTLIVKQDGVGGHLPSWVTSVTNSDDIEWKTGPNEVTVVALVRNGSEWHLGAAPFSPAAPLVRQIAVTYGNINSSADAFSLPRVPVDGNLVVFGSLSATTGGAPAASTTSAHGSTERVNETNDDTRIIMSSFVVGDGADTPDDAIEYTAVQNSVDYCLHFAVEIEGAWLYTQSAGDGVDDGSGAFDSGDVTVGAGRHVVVGALVSSKSGGSELSPDDIGVGQRFEDNHYYNTVKTTRGNYAILVGAASGETLNVSGTLVTATSDATAAVLTFSDNS